MLEIISFFDIERPIYSLIRERKIINSIEQFLHSRTSVRIVLVGLVRYVHCGLSPLVDDAGVGYRSGRLLYGMVLEAKGGSFNTAANSQIPEDL